MKRNDLIFAAIMMLVAVVLGAFGAHKLKEYLTLEQLASYKTGVRYQMIHALAILVIAQHSFSFIGERKWILGAFKLGIILFSFSIYLLHLGKILDMPSLIRVMGPVTPLGGLALIVGWALLVKALLKYKE